MNCPCNSVDGFNTCAAGLEPVIRYSRCLAVPLNGSKDLWEHRNSATIFEELLTMYIVDSTCAGLHIPVKGMSKEHSRHVMLTIILIRTKRLGWHVAGGLLDTQRIGSAVQFSSVFV